LLGLDTNYKLTTDDMASSGGIPVYLVNGTRLGVREYARKFDSERALLVNDDRIDQLIREFGISSSSPNITPYDYRRFSTTALALVLVHEVGHVWQSEHGSYTGTPLVSYEEILSAAGHTRSIEVEADKFVADRLKTAADLEKEISDQLEQGTFGKDLIEKYGGDQQKFLEEAGLKGRRMRAAVEVQSLLYKTLTTIKIREPFQGKIPVSHLDLDVRLLIYHELSYSQNTTSADSIAVMTLKDRASESKYLDARSLLEANDPEAHSNPHYILLKLLQNPDIDVRNGALKALKIDDLASEDVFLALIDALNEKYGEVSGVVYPLSRLKDRPVPYLIASLRNDSARIRGNAVVGLLRIGPEYNTSALEELKRLAATDPDDFTRSRAQHAVNAHDK